MQTRNWIINFEQDPGFYGGLLQSMQSAGYSYIPVVGSVINDFS